MIDMKKTRTLLLAVNLFITTAIGLFGMFLMISAEYTRSLGNTLFYSRFLDTNRLIPFLCFFLIVVVNMLFLMTLFRKDRTKEAIRIANPAGLIIISAQSVETLAKLEAQKMEKVHDIRTRISSMDNKALVEVMIKVPPMVSIPEISSELQSRIKERILDTTGIEIAGVQVIIDGIFESQAR